jgi:hypothetical protein
VPFIYENICKKSKNTAINAIKSAKNVNFLLFFAIFCNFSQFFDFNIIVCIAGNLSPDRKNCKFTVFYAFFHNAPRFTPFFDSHCGKFTVAQGQFYDGKFFAVNSKKRHKSENCRKSPMLSAIMFSQLAILTHQHYINIFFKIYININLKQIILSDNPILVDEM